MGDKKAYRLMKHLPDSCAGDIYYFDADERVYYKHGNKDDSYWQQHIVESNSEWFQPFGEQKEEVFVWTDELVKHFSGDPDLGANDIDIKKFKEWQRLKKIEVTKLQFHGSGRTNQFEFEIGEYFNRSDVSNKIPLIKQAIEMVLNDHYIQFDKAKSFTEEDIRYARMEAFGAARQYTISHGHPLKYPTFGDYLNSLNQPSKP